jgi:hypothetical protein
MSDDDGVRYEKTDTKVMVRPEDALALLLCYAAQVCAPTPPPPVTPTPSPPAAANSRDNGFLSFAGARF